MSKHDELQAAVRPDRKEMSKKNYHKPRLHQYEDLRTVTMGNSPGGIESGGSTGIHPFKVEGTSPNPGSSDGSSEYEDIFGGGG